MWLSLVALSAAEPSVEPPAGPPVEPAPVPSSRVQFHTSHQIAVAAFPAGAQYLFGVEGRVPLWGSDHVLLKDSYVSLGAQAALTPSYPRVGPVLTFAPVAFWDVTLSAYGTWYFGSFSSLVYFDDPGFSATTANKQALIDAGARTGGWALGASAETRLKAKVGPVVAVLEGQYRRHLVRAPEVEIAWFWEPTERLNVPADGDVFNGNAYVFVEIRAPRPATDGAPADDRKLWVGVVGMWQLCPQSGDENVLLGPVAFWKPASAPAAPTLIMGAQAWLESGFTPVLPPYTFVAARWER